MGTKTEDETAAESAAKPAKPEADEAVDAVKMEKSTASEEAGEVVDDTDDADELDMVDEADEVAPAKSSGVFTGAAAVVSAALGVIGLSGGWLGTVAAARSNIAGQLEMQKSQSAGIADQIQALYGDSWQVTALIAGAFALAALVVGFVVLVRPAFGAPDQEQAPWIKSVAWAGVALGVIGLLLAIAKYSDLIYGLPSAS